jgi:hypothetical protein
MILGVITLFSGVLLLKNHKLRAPRPPHIAPKKYPNPGSECQSAYQR